MKKAIKWTLFFIILACIVIYIVSAIVTPEQNKMVTDKVTEWLNTPVGVAGISTTIGGIFAYIVTKFIFANSKFGRRELDYIKNDTEEFKKIIVEHEQSVNDKVSEYENKYKDLEENCNNQVSIMLEQFEDLQKKTINALKTIPNKKVQAVVDEYESQYAEYKEEVIERTIHTNDYIERKFKELEDMINEAKETINSETEAA